MDAKYLTTFFKDGTAVQEENPLNVILDDGTQELHLINLYPNIKGQQVEAFGGAITAAVGNVLERMPPKRAEEVIQAYFGPNGNGYRRIRTHIDSCDFSPKQYCADDDAEDKDFLNFSIQYDEKHIIPWIKAAYRAANTEIPVMLSPWSPPAYMKTNNERVGGGKLKPEYYSRWAQYLCRYIQAYRDHGILVASLSVQNEPNAVQTWDSCLYTAEEESLFLSKYLYPEMCRANLGDIELFVWDHNKERLFDRATEVISPETDDKIAGFAFHWYTGDHFDALRLVRRYYPNKKLLFSEGCIEYSRFTDNQQENAGIYAHDMLGNFAAGMNGFLDWNICLDEQGGPNYAGNYCEAPIICNTQKGEVEYKLSYYYIGHCSRYILPGAHQIATTKYSNAISLAAFENPNGEIVVVIYNEAPEELPICIRLDGKIIELKMESESIATVFIKR